MNVNTTGGCNNLYTQSAGWLIDQDGEDQPTATKILTVKQIS